MPNLSRVSTSKSVSENAEIRKANKQYFQQIPDLIEVEIALSKGRIYDTHRAYTDNFIGSLAHFYDKNGFLTSEDTGANGVGQLGKLRDMISLDKNRKAGTDYVTNQQRESSEWIGEPEQERLLQLKLKAIIDTNYNGQKGRMLSFETKAGDVVIYRGKGKNFDLIKKGRCYMVKAKINKHTIWKGVKQTSLKYAECHGEIDAQF